MGETGPLKTITQVTRETGVPGTTLRYYEKEGLLQPAGRTAAGYRLYSQADLDRLAFIRSAQAIGFTLADIHTLLSLDGRSDCACRTAVEPLLKQRIGDIEQRIQELESVRRTLSRALRRCRASKERCLVLSDLRESNGSPPGIGGVREGAKRDAPRGTGQSDTGG